MRGWRDSFGHQQAGQCRKEYKTPATIQWARHSPTTINFSFSSLPFFSFPFLSMQSFEIIFYSSSSSCDWEECRKYGKHALWKSIVLHGGHSHTCHVSCVSSVAGSSSSSLTYSTHEPKGPNIRNPFDEGSEKIPNLRNEIAGSLPMGINIRSVVSPTGFS